MGADHLREFYEHHPPDLRSITDVNRRHFRFLLPNGRFFKIKDTVRSAQDLQDWILRLCPSDVYYSTSRYLDPSSVASRPKSRTDRWGPGNVVLGNDVAFDLDRRPLSMMNLEKARKDAVMLLDLLQAKDFPLKYVAFSGSKGFHLVFEDVDGTIEPDLHTREAAIIARRKALVKEVVDKGIPIDSSVTVDTRRIIRLPGTINSKTGYCCQCLTVEQLRAPVGDWIDGIAKLPEHSRIPTFKMRTFPKLLKRKKVALPDPGPERAYTTFITSSVLGTKGRHAVLLSLPKGPLDRTIVALREVQGRFDLTDLYLFALPRAYQVICLKTVQRNRYQKILDCIGSSSAAQLRTYERVSLRMGPLVDAEMRFLEPQASFVTYLECRPEVRDANFVSRGHIAFLRRNGLTPFPHEKVHGNEEFKLVDAEIRL